MRRPVLPAPLLAAALLAGGLAALPANAQTPSSTVVLESGGTPDTRPFPDDVFTVPDAAQATGLRVALPADGCEADGTCADLAVLNTLDGFDVRPRVALPFSGPVDLGSITGDSVHVDGPDGFRTSLTQLVQDPSTGDVSGYPVAYLRPATRYTLVVGSGIRDADGSAVAPVCAGGPCPPGTDLRRTTFTTMTTTSVLDRVRTALDDGSAYRAAGIADAARTLRFDTADSGTRSVFPTSDTSTRIERRDQVLADPSAAGAFTTTAVPNTARSFAFYGFGSITSPQYLTPSVRIPTVPTTQTPAPTGSARLGVAMAAPAPVAGSCLKPVVFGHGFTRSKYDLFLAADTLGDSRLAVFATDVVGHGSGSGSTYRVTTAAGTVTTGTALGRGRDLDRDGTISDTEGVGTAGIVSSRDGLLQTVVDQMALVRALQQGVDVDGDGTVDTCTGPGAVAYYGQSFGGIYGTMLLGSDPSVRVGVPNVAGGPVPEVSRLGGFRPLLAASLGRLANGGPGLSGFTESLPLRRGAPVRDPLQGSLPIQEALARATWATRSGSPEAYAPRLARTGAFSSKEVLFQVAYGDGTVPNPTSGELLRAGDLYDRAWVYRNDRTADAASNPHGFLLNPFLPAHGQAQEQIRQLLASGGADVVDPDGDGPVWENADRGSATDYRLQLDCLHYPDPQTGLGQVRTSPAADCSDASTSVVPARGDDALRLVTLPAATRVLDTRAAGGSRVTGRVSVDLRGVVPDAAAQAAVLNVTVTGATGAGHVVVFPAGAPVPPTSNVNVQAAVPGRDAATQANEAVVRLSQDRRVDLDVATTAHVVVDVVGYLTTRTPGGSGRLEPVAAQRLLDTRTTSEPRRTGDVEVDLSGTPAATATAVVLNVTAASPLARGYVVAHATGTPEPATSNVNFERGRTQANEVVVAVGPGGKVTLGVAGGPTAVVVDLVGLVRPVPTAGGTTSGTAVGGYAAL
ncbi:MAG: hypothetical protein JWO60_1328, partial [Frankiales bacterium]|nr:hypothetical protein [Frankiales bacterium]